MLHGLDWTRMGAVRGIAGSGRPEVDGVFLCRDEFEVEFFVGFDATALPVDVWSVEGVEKHELVEAPEGFVYVPRPIPARQLTLLHRDEWPRAGRATSSPAAYASTLTIALDDGTVLDDEQARDWARRASRDEP
jgi:hypothetical protein